MFTGIVRELGVVEATDGGDEGIRLRIRAAQAAAQAALGDSVSVNGVCLTVAEVDGDALSFDAVPETLSRIHARPLAGERRSSISSPRCVPASRSAATSCRAMSTGWGGCWPCLARGTAPAWR